MYIHEVSNLNFQDTVFPSGKNLKPRLKKLISMAKLLILYKIDYRFKYITKTNTTLHLVTKNRILNIDNRI